MIHECPRQCSTPARCGMVSFHDLPRRNKSRLDTMLKPFHIHSTITFEICLDGVKLAAGMGWIDRWNLPCYGCPWVQPCQQSWRLQAGYTFPDSQKIMFLTTSHQSISHLAGRKLCHLSRRSSRWHWWRVDKAFFVV